MAQNLGVTKGSFYWHFKDIADLRQRILDHWMEQYSDAISENPEFIEADPIDGLIAAMTRIREQGLDEFEVAIRCWADHDPIADEVVRVVYQRRVRFVRNFFTRLGFRGIDAEMRTRSLLCFMSWERKMFVKESQTQQLKLLKLHIEMLTAT